MKNTKRIFSLLLTVVMVLSLVCTAFAAGEGDTGSITIQNPKEGETYNAYKVFDVTYSDATVPEGEEKPYSYTIDSAASENWFKEVVAYMGSIWNTDENPDKYTLTVVAPSDKGVYTGNGITLTPSASNPAEYIVTTTADFDAPNFAKFLKSIVDTKSTDEKVLKTNIASIFTNNTTDENAAMFKDYTFNKDGNEFRAQGTAPNVTASIDNLDLGYYFVTSSQGALCNLTTTNNEVTIHDKNDHPSVDKKIEEGGTTVDKNNGDIGDVVNYVITSKVPDMTLFDKYYFVVKDTLSAGLTFNSITSIKVGENSLQRVYVNGGDYYTDTTYTEATKVTINPNHTNNHYYTLETSGNTDIKIVFVDFIQYKGQENAPIEIKYTATINENAVIGAEDGNPNSVKLEYSQDPTIEDNGEPGKPDEPSPTYPKGETPESTTRTYVTGVELVKVDESGNNPLTGAEFEITGDVETVVTRKDINYIKDDTGEYYHLILKSDGETKDDSYTKDAPTVNENFDNSNLYEKKADGITIQRYRKELTEETFVTSDTVTAKGVVGADGKLRFDGLSKGTYHIKEIKAPDGYNLLDGQIDLTIDWNGTGATADDCTWTYTWTYSGADTNVTAQPDTSNQTGTITVQNKHGSLLPETGGIGTTIFYVVGSIMLVGAGVLLVTKKRMNAAK